tara:strand:- start:409 stop:606 length:198 start_codon:yes stop_codon:yes gene_type:complete
MRKITLKTKGLSSKQYSTLILELNIVAKNWKRFGGDITIQAAGAERIISWGNKSHETIRIKPRYH